MKIIQVLFFTILIIPLPISYSAYSAKIQDEFIGENNAFNQVWRELKYQAINEKTEPKKRMYRCIPNSFCQQNPNDPKCLEAVSTGKNCTVHYLTAEQLKYYKVIVVGNCIMKNQSHFDSYEEIGRLEKNGMFIWRLSEGFPSMWVMDFSGRLYIAPLQYPGRFNHSSFLAGQPVLCAGEIQVRDGRIVKMNNRSGHYLPTIKEFRAAVKLLQGKGYKSDFEVICYGNDRENAFEKASTIAQAEDGNQPEQLQAPKAKPAERGNGYDQYVVDGDFNEQKKDDAYTQYQLDGE